MHPLAFVAAAPAPTRRIRVDAVLRLALPRGWVQRDGARRVLQKVQPPPNAIESRAAQRHVLLPPRRSEGSEKALVENRANGIDPAGVHELAHDRLELGPPNWTRMRTRQKGSQMIDILGFLTRWQGNRVSVPKAPKSSM